MSSPNFTDQTIWTGDNLPIMRGMNSESVDLIYLDPPFNSNTNYAAPIGSEAAGAEFTDTWSLRDIDAEWIELIEGRHPRLYRVLLAAMTDSAKSYLAYMAVRLIEMRRILKPTGSIYLHCDPTMSHYLKLVMDAVFRTYIRGGGAGGLLMRLYGLISVGQAQQNIFRECTMYFCSLQNHTVQHSTS